MYLKLTSSLLYPTPHIFSLSHTHTHKINLKIETEREAGEGFLETSRVSSAKEEGGEVDMNIRHQEAKTEVVYAMPKPPFS